MMWLWILLVPLALTAGVWIVETARSGQHRRHALRLEHLRAREHLLERREAAERGPAPVCGCGHHLAKHDRQHRCQEIVQVPRGWDADRRPIGFEPGRCSCQRYVGPQPLSEIYAEELTDPDWLPGPRPDAGEDVVGESATGTETTGGPDSLPEAGSSSSRADEDAGDRETPSGRGGQDTGRGGMGEQGTDRHTGGEDTGSGAAGRDGGD